MPAVDIYTNDKRELVLKAELSDINEEDIELTIEDNTLTLRGERKFDTEVPKEAVSSHRAKFWFVHADVRAAADGRRREGQRPVPRAVLLKVLLPLREEAKPRQIKSRSPRKSRRWGGVGKHPRLTRPRRRGVHSTRSDHRAFSASPPVLSAT